MLLKYNLSQILESHSLAELKKIAKELSFPGYSKMKKEKLVQLLCSKILDRESLELKFLAATDKEIQLLENAINKKVIIEEISFSYDYWYNLFFAFITIENEVHIPIEIVKAYLEIKNTKKYKDARTRNAVIDQYALACTNLYAIIEIDKFLEIINTQTNLDFSKEEVIMWCTLREICRGCSMYFYLDGYIMIETFGDNILGVLEDYHDMLSKQMSKPYYVPEKGELLKYKNNIYIDENKSFKDMMTFIIENMKNTNIAAYGYCADIQLEIRSGAMPKEVIDECSRTGMNFKNKSQLNDFLQLLMEMYNNTRIPENRGYTPSEIHEILSESDEMPFDTKKRLIDMEFFVPVMPATPGTPGIKYIQGIPNLDRKDNVIPFPSNSDILSKVHPNSFCPCGSGKKYKKCCGKNMN